MHFDTDIKTNIKQIGIGNILLGAVLALIFFLIGSLDISSACGIITGCFISFLNFFLLAYTLQKALNNGKNPKAMVTFSYTGRVLLQMGLAIASIVFLHLNPLSVLIPLVFPRLVIFYLQVTKQAVPTGGDKNGRSN